MADSSKNGKKRSAPDIDISMPNAKEKTSWTVTLIIWAVVLALFLLVIFFEFSVGSMIVLVFVLIFGVLSLWFGWHLIVQRGALTWMRLAQKPAKLLASGDVEGAKATYQKALERARRFGPHDHR